MRNIAKYCDVLVIGAGRQAVQLLLALVNPERKSYLSNTKNILAAWLNRHN